MSNIYQLPKEIEELMSTYYSSFDPDTGEQVATDEEVEERLKSLKEKENKKDEIIDWILKTRANAQAQKNALDLEIERLSKSSARESKTVDKMESMITYFLPPTELQEMTQFGNWRVGYRKSEAVKIDDESKIPHEFIKIPEPKPAPDKTAIKEALKEGKEIPGASLEVRNNLQVK